MFRPFFSLLIIVFIASGIQGQNLVASTKTASDKAAATEPAKSSPQTTENNECRVCRWFELQTASIIAMYRFQETDKGITSYNQLQHKEVFKGRFKFDREGRFSLTAGVGTGNSFIGSYINTGIGRGHGATNLYLKQLYFAARPIEGFEVQAGGLYLTRGESTEVTSYDDDGFITGYRFSLRRPRNAFFNEVSVTYGYLGDVTTPDLRKRFHRLKQSNYHQFLVAKTFGRRAQFSADYTFHSGVETLRQAARVMTKELKVIDSIRFENYQRVDVNPAYGFAVRGEKTIGKFSTYGGFTSVDRRNGTLNADRIGPGKRVFGYAEYKITPSVSVNIFAARAVANEFPMSHRTRVDVSLNFNLLKALQKLSIF